MMFCLFPISSLPPLPYTHTHTHTHNQDIFSECLYLEFPLYTNNVTFTCVAVSTEVRIESVDFVAGRFVVVGEELELRVRGVDDNGHIIPPDTVFTWCITSFFGKSLPLPLPLCVKTSLQILHAMPTTKWRQLNPIIP